MTFLRTFIPFRPTEGGRERASASGVSEQAGERASVQVSEHARDRADKRANERASE